MRTIYRNLCDWIERRYDNLGALPEADHFGIRNTVIAYVYVPNGTLWLRQNTAACGLSRTTGGRRYRRRSDAGEQIWRRVLRLSESRCMMKPDGSSSSAGLCFWVVLGGRYCNFPGGAGKLQCSEGKLSKNQAFLLRLCYSPCDVIALQSPLS